MAKKKKREAEVPAGVDPADAAFKAGNYAGVRALAKSGSDSAKKLLGLVTIDMGQIAVGLFAMVVVLVAAFITLRGR